MGSASFSWFSGHSDSSDLNIRAEKIPHRERFDCIKGVLICCVVTDHNTEIIELAPSLKYLMESFDVFAFFLIPFCFSGKSFSINYFRDRAVRYLVPFLWFYSLSSFLYLFIVQKQTLDAAFCHYWAGLILMSPDMIKQASGFLLFWFLPCYFILILMRSICLHNKIAKNLILFIAMSFHLYWAAEAIQYRAYIPYSISTALFCLPVCFVFEKIWPSIRQNDYFQKISAFVFIASLCLIVGFKSKMYLYEGVLPSVQQPFWLIIHDLCVLSVIPFFYYVFGLVNSKTIAFIGKYSLGIYLVHQLIYQAMVRIGVIGNSVLFALGEIVTTVFLAAAVVLFIYRFEFTRKILFPRNLRDMKSALFKTTSMKF